MLSLLDPGCPLPVAFEAFDEPHRIELRFHDIIEPTPGMEAPRPEHIGQLLALGRDLATRGADNLHLLVHCHAGFSRSPAALALLLAQARPWLRAEGIAAAVLQIRPKAWPNLRVIELGDEALDRRGEIVAAASRIYRVRLQQQPELGEMIIANGRMREVEAGRV